MQTTPPSLTAADQALIEQIHLLGRHPGAGSKAEEVLTLFVRRLLWKLASRPRWGLSDVDAEDAVSELTRPVLDVVVATYDPTKSRPSTFVYGIGWRKLARWIERDRRQRGVPLSDRTAARIADRGPAVGSELELEDDMNSFRRLLAEFRATEKLPPRELKALEAVLAGRPADKGAKCALMKRLRSWISDQARPTSSPGG